MQSYMLIEQAEAPRVTRQLRQQFGRMAFVTDEGTVELTVNSLGAWSVQIGPAPTKGGEFVKVANGSVKVPALSPGNPHPRDDGLVAERDYLIRLDESRKAHIQRLVQERDYFRDLA